MRYHSERIANNNRSLNAKAFTLIEVLTALAILAFISSSVVVVINRCMESAADSELRMQAFEVARENMERLLCSDSVSESVEYGTSDKYPAIQWERRVEVFSEPISSAMWVKGICSAEYTDTAGDEQTIELTHWLTDLTDEQMLKINEAKESQKELLAEQIIESTEDAADYADVDEETIQQWVDNGMHTTKDGRYLKYELDLYKTTDGNPTVEQRKQLAKIYTDVLVAAGEQPPSTDRQEPQVDDKDRPLTESDFRKMTREEILEYLKEFISRFQQ